MNHTCAIGGDAKKKEMFAVSKTVIVDGVEKTEIVGEEKEVSVVGWQSYEQFREKFELAVKHGKMT